MGGGQVGGLNILPKKRWHVRTKDNIARVRRDEAKAADEERQKQERAALAEQEARTDLLRQKAAKKYVGKPDSSESSMPSTSAEMRPERPQHVNFFADLEEQERTFGTNKEYEKEKKAEKEAEEMKIGLLHFLGEGSHESLKTRPWYEAIDRRSAVKPKLDTDQKAVPVELSRPSTSGLTTHFEGRFTQRSDIGKVKEKHKKTHKSKKEKRRKRKRSLSTSSSSSYEWVSDAGSDVEEIGRQDRPPPPKKVKKTKEELKAEEKAQMDKLRADRVRREAEEKCRADELMRKIRGGGKPTDEEIPKSDVVPTSRQRQQKYNSQFNPDICRQNRPK